MHPHHILCLIKGSINHFFSILVLFKLCFLASLNIIISCHTNFERWKIIVFKFDKATSINLYKEEHVTWRIWKPLKELFFSYHIYFLKASFSMDESYNGLTKASLIKWLSVRVRTKLLSVRVPLHSLKVQILRLFRAKSSLTFREL